MSDRCVLLLAGEGESTRIVYHALRRSLPATVRLEVILEDRVSRRTLVGRRAKRLGVRKIVGQILFMIAVVPLLRLRGKRRVEAIKKRYSLDDSPLPEPVHRVASANSEAARSLLRSLFPTVVVVNGTRILQPDTLAAVGAPFLNMHAGITPGYRGVHGGYWALAEGRGDLVGTTIHKVDEGIDTGAVVTQAYFSITRRDSFCTYPFLHVAVGLPKLVQAVEAALDGSTDSTIPYSDVPSRLRYHPTIWGYVRRRIRRGVR